MRPMIAWCAWASAALALLLTATFVWALVNRSVLMIAAVPTLVAAGWVVQQAVALFLIRRPFDDKWAEASYRTVSRSVLGVTAVLLLGDVLLLVIGQELGAALAYTALMLLSTGVGLLSLRAVVR